MYYFDQSGVIKRDWVEENGKWDFLDRTGVRQAGWINESCKQYYITTNRELKSNINNPGNINQSVSLSMQKDIGDFSHLDGIGWVKNKYNWYLLYGQ